MRYIETKELSMRVEYIGVGRHTDRHQIEFVAALLVRMFRHLTGLHIKPTRICFMHNRRSLPAQFRAFFGNNVEFGSEMDEVSFDGRVRNEPVVSADPYLNKLLIDFCEDALSRRRAHRTSLRVTVENSLAQLLPHGKARAKEVAKRLGVSQRTLARRLSLEGVTFSNVLEELRVDLAGS